MDASASPQVIIADDDPQAQQLIHHILENAGIEVAGLADDGYEVIELIEEFEPDVVLLDLTMPNMDGFEVIGKIRDTNQAIQILVVSAHEDPALLQRAILAGANGYLTKMQLSSHLSRSISAVLSGDFAVADPKLLQEVFAVGDQLPSKGNMETKNGLSELLESLTPREKTVLNLIAQGYDNQTIAEQLFISYNTVKSHTTSIFDKLQVEDRTQAAVLALKCGFVESS